MDMSSSAGNNNSSQRAAGYSGNQEHSGPLHSFLEHTTLLIFPVVFVLNLQWASSRLYELELLWLVALAVPLGIIGGDFISGLVHWAADTYGSDDMRVIDRVWLNLSPSSHLPARHLHARSGGNYRQRLHPGGAGALSISLPDVVDSAVRAVGVWGCFFRVDCGSHRRDEPVSQVGASGESFFLCALVATKTAGVGAAASQAASHATV